MSGNDIRIGGTIDAATKFTFANLLAIIKVGWLPIALTLGLSAAIAWTLWQPLILAYLEFFEVFGAAMDTAASGEAAQSADFQFDEKIFEAALEETGWANFTLGYIGVIGVSLLGFAIPITAYCRMFVLGERYSGPFYLRLGAREINVALTYLAITVLLAVGSVVVASAGIIVLGIVASALGDSAQAMIGLLTFVYFIAVMVFFFWLFARLGLALPAASIEGGRSIGRAWALTKGVGGKIAWAFVLGYLVITVFSMIVMMVLSMITGLILAILVGLGSQLAPVFVGGLWLMGYIAFYCVATAFFMALLAGPYKKLTEGAA